MGIIVQHKDIVTKHDKRYFKRCSSNDILYATFGFTVEGEVEMRTLHILPFDSNRKRMSVIVEHPVTHEIILYCKGADSAIFTNLKPKSPGKTTSLCYFVQVCLNISEKVRDVFCSIFGGKHIVDLLIQETKLRKICGTTPWTI